VVPPCGTPVALPGALPRRLATDRPPHDRHDLVHVGLALPAVNCVRETAGNVVLEHEHRHLVRRRRHGLDLLEDIEAVCLVLDEPLKAASLALDPPQPVEELGAVLRVGVAEVPRVVPRVLVRPARHTVGQYAMERRTRQPR
jgi:hypothetical protein